MKTQNSKGKYRKIINHYTLCTVPEPFLVVVAKLRRSGTFFDREAVLEYYKLRRWKIRYSVFVPAILSQSETASTNLMSF